MTSQRRSKMTKKDRKTMGRPFRSTSSFSSFCPCPFPSCPRLSTQAKTHQEQEEEEAASAAQEVKRWLAPSLSPSSYACDKRPKLPTTQMKMKMKKNTFASCSSSSCSARRPSPCSHDFPSRDQCFRDSRAVHYQTQPHQRRHSCQRRSRVALCRWTRQQGLRD